MPFRLQYILFLLVFVAVGCSRHSDPALVRLEQMASSGDDSAHVALDSLLSLDPAQFSEADRHFYDFLSVKIADKAYVNHTSDSLILSVISHEEAHQGNGRYPEALYYGGRVYSDLGDYPTALQYFQQALDELPGDTNTKLRAIVLSQTAHLLNSLQLYKQAIPYLEKAIAINELRNDSVCMMHNTHLLGTLHLNQDRYDEAEDCFRRARDLARKVSKTDIYQQDVYLATIKCHKGEPDSALSLIRPVMANINGIDRPAALANAADIYFKAGILDTALMYAGELIHKSNYNDIAVYRIAFSAELIDLMPHDSISSYIAGYRNHIDEYLKQNVYRNALMYNHCLHEREKVKAERDKANLLLTIAFILVVVICRLTIVVYNQKYKRKRNLLQLHQALDNLKTLRKSMASGNNEPLTLDITSEQDSVQDLKDRLKTELLEIIKANSNSQLISPVIFHSEAYAKLQSYIERAAVVPESNSLWKDLDKVVTESSKNFKYRLQLLLGGKPTDIDYNMALLIKCGIIPTHMSILLGRTKGAITYRREKFCTKIFGQKMEPGLIDKLIHLL